MSGIDEENKCDRCNRIPANHTIRVGEASLFNVCFSCKEKIKVEIRVNSSGKYELALETLANGELPDGDAPNMPTIMFAEDVLEGVKREKSNSTA